jgi:hypothetical protein
MVSPPRRIEPGCYLKNHTSIRRGGHSVTFRDRQLIFQMSLFAVLLRVDCPEAHIFIL